MTIAIIAIVLLVILALWAFLIAPNPRCRRALIWKGTFFAHRGLHTDEISENSLAAFENACKNGYGMELDVQFTKDKKLVVFHDDDLQRMTGVPGLVRDKTFEEIRQLSLVTDGAEIPTFEEMLSLVDSRQPLCVEIKTCPNIGELTRATVEALRKYEGPYVVESFNPLCLRCLRRISPDIIRGQLVTTYQDNLKSSGNVLSFALSCLLLNFLGRPDFIACEDSMHNGLTIKIQKGIFKTPMAAWTITDAENARALAAKGEMPIFEKCRP